MSDRELVWVDSDECASRNLCAACRDTSEHGCEFRQNLQDYGWQLPRAERDFACPFGVPWGGSLDAARAIAEPTIEEQMKALFESLKSWRRAGKPIATKDVVMQRVTACRSCEHWRGSARFYLGKCRLCGCSRMKHYLATAQCPDKPPRWRRVVDT